MIKINGREINLDSLRVKVERRRARGLLWDEDEAAPGGLEQLPDLDVRSYFGIQYRLHDSLAKHGAKLEPSLDYGRRERGESRYVSRALRPWRKVKRKLITAPNEGYLQQQELFNTYAVKSLDAAARLYHAMKWEGQGMDRDEAPAAQETPELLGPDALDGLLSGTGGKLAFVGLPGPTCLERVLERGRLLVGVDPDDRKVAYYQSLFLPAFWQHPLTLPRGQDFSGCGALVVTDPDTISAQGLDSILGEARARLSRGGGGAAAGEPGRVAQPAGDTPGPPLPGGKPAGRRSSSPGCWSGTVTGSSPSSGATPSSCAARRRRRRVAEEARRTCRGTWRRSGAGRDGGPEGAEGAEE